MGLFSRKPKVTAQDRQNAKAAFSRMGTCFKKLESAKSIDTYFTEWEKYLEEYRIVSLYEDKGVKMSMPSKAMHALVAKEVPRLERETVARGYDRLQRDMAKLSTDAGRKKKAVRFFSELEFYYPRLQASTVEYIKQLRANCRYVDD